DVVGVCAGAVTSALRPDVVGVFAGAVTSALRPDVVGVFAGAVTSALRPDVVGVFAGAVTSALRPDARQTYLFYRACGGTFGTCRFAGFSDIRHDPNAPPQ